MRADLAYMLLIVLVPILPAFALFRFLPSTADVGGPLKGLNVKISGAFAGYIVGVLVSWQVATSLLEPTWADNWKVYGHVAFIDASSAHPAPPELVVMVRPPVPDIQSNGDLQVTIPIARFHNGPEDIPRLVLALKGYETVNVPLDSDHKHLAAYGGSDYQVIFDRKRHEIQIAKPINRKAHNDDPSAAIVVLCTLRTRKHEGTSRILHWCSGSPGSFRLRR